jgi:uncharacterized damage-inducible protein DinB
MRATPVPAHDHQKLHKNFTKHHPFCFLPSAFCLLLSAAASCRLLSAKLERMETKRLASQLRRSYEGQAWHGPSLRELLEGVTSEQAAAKPISGAHSIWELVLHVTAWEQAALGFLEGKKYETLAGEKDWPPVQETWQAALDAFGSASHALVAAIRAMPEEKLNESAGGAEYNFYFLLHGVVQHNLYHAGQIALLKRAL